MDYHGSNGYGRAYQHALDGNWGVLDATDAAGHLAALGLADPARTVISGASAGGYTVLRALATTGRFAAGTAGTVPRFQRHHTTDLIGPWPQAAETYRRRSALRDPDRITVPVLLVHGSRDPIAALGPIADLARPAAGGQYRLHVPARAGGRPQLRPRRDRAVPDGRVGALPAGPRL